ncbi:EGF domain-containing protein [Trichostrongylus colubriformis]|uniref:EGF domain-containing protein n=1 Tax=Trichostrongylus colubriformis TaxID=6319 RepID=A0AAN8EWY8_TRICO
MSSSPSSRIWVGPLLLILVIALIYIFSLMPNTPPHRELTPLLDDAHHVRTFRLGDHEITESVHELKVEVPPELLSSSCLNGGFLNETDGGCICLHLYTGPHCERPICSKFGRYSEEEGRCICDGDYVGEHCESRCHGWVNQTTGYMGMSCATCDPTSGRECEIPSKRRGAVNSRLTLSGLSFCMITIGLLCVTARRRRAGPLPTSEDTWYRVFQPAQTRTARCRHDLMCGGSWIPRDRALLVAPGRAAVVHGNSRSSSRGRRLTTPPPSYTSVDILADDQSPPTYEEATRIMENSTNNAALIQELIDETVQTVEAKDESLQVAEGSTNATTQTSTQDDENADTKTTMASSI